MIKYKQNFPGFMLLSKLWIFTMIYICSSVFEIESIYVSNKNRRKLFNYVKITSNKPFTKQFLLTEVTANKPIKVDETNNNIHYVKSATVSSEDTINFTLNIPTTKAKKIVSTPFHSIKKYLERGKPPSKSTSCEPSSTLQSPKETCNTSSGLFLDTTKSLKFTITETTTDSTALLTKYLLNSTLKSTSQQSQKTCNTSGLFGETTRKTNFRNTETSIDKNQISSTQFSTKYTTNSNVKNTSQKLHQETCTESFGLDDTTKENTFISRKMSTDKNHLNSIPFSTKYTSSPKLKGTTQQLRQEMCNTSFGLFEKFTNYVTSTNKYILNSNSTPLSTKYAFETTLKIASNATPVTCDKEANYTTAPTLITASTIAPIESTTIEVVQTKLTSISIESLSNECSPNLTSTMNYLDSELKNNSLNSSSDWRNHTNTFASCLVPNSTIQVVANDSTTLSPKTTKTLSVNQTLNESLINLSSPLNYLNSKLKNIKKLIKNICNSNSTPRWNLTTPSVNSTMVSRPISSVHTTILPVLKNLSSNSTPTCSDTVTSLPNVSLNTCSFYTDNFSTKSYNLKTIYNLTTTPLQHLTSNSIIIFSNKSDDLSTTKKIKLNKTDNVKQPNRTESNSGSWLSSLFNPIKNKLWFLWAENNNRPNGTVSLNHSINKTNYNLTINETTKDVLSAMYVGSLNTTNLTLYVPMKDNINKTNPFVYTSNITSLVNITNNSSDPTVVIVNNTIVSVIENGSHVEPATFNAKKNGTWLGRIRAIVVHWMGDVYDCLTSHTEPVAFKDIRFFLYTRKNQNKPEELFLKMEDLETTTEDISDLPKPVKELNMNICNNTERRSTEYDRKSIKPTTIKAETDTQTANCTDDNVEEYVRDVKRKKNVRKKQKYKDILGKQKSETEGTHLNSKHVERAKKKHRRKKQKNRRASSGKHRSENTSKHDRKHDKHRMKDCVRPNCSRKKDFVGLNPAKSIYSKFFNVLYPTKIIIHGYTQSYLEDSMVAIREAYLTKAPFNIIMVDWSSLSHSPCYPMVAKQSKTMGIIVSHLIEQLVRGGIDMATVHVIGFSIGAQIAGFAGAALETGDVSRVTGLDPASPFYDADPGSSLDATDATFVDVIHTSAGFLGQPGPIGHADFYPNGGSQQPGCEFTALACSHDRAALLFAESITSDTGFPAFECPSWEDFQNGECNSTSGAVWMGDPCLSRTRGIFFLATADTEPFTDLRQHNKTKKSLFSGFFK